MLRDDTKNVCIGGYLPLGSVYFFITFRILMFYLLCNDLSRVVLFVKTESVKEVFS